jgi:hypothetical protein
MPKQKKSNKDVNEALSETDETIEQLIENRKTVADAYRKILNSLEEKLKKDK